MNWIKVSAEGSSSPFIARIFMGLLSLRDQLFLTQLHSDEKDQKLAQFDLRFKPLFEAAQAARDAAIEINNLVNNHIEAINDSAIVKYSESSYTILETIDTPLGQAVDALLDQSIVATKTGLQEILIDPLGLDIGYFFQKPLEFEKGIELLRESGDENLAEYLEISRDLWHSNLQELRAQHEHTGWTLEKISYERTGVNKVSVRLPTIHGLPIDEFSRLTANRVLLFIENMVVYALERHCSLPIFVLEIPEHLRDPSNPQKFAIAPKGIDNRRAWELSHSDGMEFF